MNSSEKCKRSCLCLSLLFLAFLSFVPACEASVNKSTSSILVSSVNVPNWFDFAAGARYRSSVFSTFVTCEGTSCTNYDSCKTKYYNNDACDTANDSNDDYLYTDTENEQNTWPVSQNFKITASASATSGDYITGIKLDWIGKATGTPSTSTWTTADKGIGSASCTGSSVSSCSFCVQGGICDKPVIPQEYLGVMNAPGGEERRFYFRVTYTSKNGDKVTTGYDTAYVLDKYYWLVVCGPPCGNSCSLYQPTVALGSVSVPANTCSGLGTPYTATWSYGNVPSSGGPSTATLYVRKVGSTVVNSASVGSATSFTIPNSWLAYNTQYEWRVVSNFSGLGCSWSTDSGYSKTFTTPHAYPVPSFTVKNTSGTDCTVSGACRATTDTIVFDGSASTASTATKTYAWTVKEGTTTVATGTGVTFSKVFSTQVSRTVTLKVTDSDSTSHYCTASKTFVLGAPGCVAGNPAITTSETGPTGNTCDGLNDGTNSYTANWTLPAGINQTKYQVVVKNSGGTVVADSGVQTNATARSYKILGSKLSPGVSYTWTLYFYGNNGGSCTWNNVAYANSDGFAVPASYGYLYPTLSVTSLWGTNCLGGGCHTNETLNFASSSSNAGSSYAWTVTNGTETKTGTGPNYSALFSSLGNYTAQVTASYGGNSCTTTKPFTLTSAGCIDLHMDAGLANPSTAGLCRAGLNDSDAYYILSWWSDNKPADVSQFFYYISVTDISTGSVVGSIGGVDARTYYPIPTDWIDGGYGHQYKWDLTVKYGDGGGCGCYGCSWIKTLTGNFTTPGKYPTPNFTITDSAGVKDCTTYEACNAEQDIKFTNASTATGTPTLTWTGDTTGTGSPLTKSFATAGTYRSKLTVADSNGTCSLEKEFTLAGPACTESATIVPTSMTVSGSYCDTYEYVLGWQDTKSSASMDPKTYTIEIEDLKTGSVFTEADLIYSTPYYQISGSEIGFGADNVRRWRVTMHYEDGVCAYDETSAWSNDGGEDFNIYPLKHAYPIPDFYATSDGGTKDCRNNECMAPSTVHFDASKSTYYTANPPVYTWLLDDETVPRVGETFDAELYGTDHSVSLTVTDEDGYVCAIDKAEPRLKKNMVKWNEVAP